MPLRIRDSQQVITAFFDEPLQAVALTFQADAPAELREEHEEAENDTPEGQPEERPEDGSNVVNVDFTRKK